MIKSDALTRNSVVTGVLLNLIVSMIFIVFIVLGYKSTSENAAIQDDTFKAHFQSRLILKSINGINHSRANILMGQKINNRDLINEAENDFLGAKSNYNLLISEQTINKSHLSKSFTNAFDEIAASFETVFKNVNPVEEKIALNTILLKSEDLIQKMHAEESSLWVDVALKLYEYSKIKTRNLNIFYALTICFVLIQFAFIYFTIIKYQLNKKISLQHEKLILQTRLSTLGMMSAELAHEINSPLMVIDGRLRILHKELLSSETQNEKLLTNLEIIKRNSIRIQGIIKNFKTMSKSGENDDFEIFYLVSIFDDVLDLVSQKLSDENIEFIVQNVPADVSVMARRIQVVQVLTNLINNSLDAIRGNTEAWIRVDTIIEEDTITIMVTDSGNGISTEHINKIFDPFYSTKGSVAGTGLGLSISKKIMKEHGGDLIYNTSSPHTQFILTLKNKRAHS